MSFKLTIRGVKETVGNLRRMEQKMVDFAFNKALEDLAIKIREISMDKVPVERGSLKQAFSIQKVGGSWVCGYNTQYAAYQHQGMRKDGSRIIRNRPGGGESFFLSGPVQKNQQALLKFLQERFKIHLQNSIK